ncbi:MAG: hypothetical protein KAY37_10080 [Phycisphaerae bacterium]|nr:hypothetical protein [Phycisphaerae bacterium]
MTARRRAHAFFGGLTKKSGNCPGSGKTSLCETACLWALVYGHREFVALIGSDEEHAANMLDSIPGSKASGAIIRVAGITGRIRGMKHKRPDGHAVRPALVLIDDPQTDASARSPSQCAMRERILAGAILGLAGPGRKIAGLMTITVVRPGDMADRLLDRDKHPQWQDGWPTLSPTRVDDFLSRGRIF